jgi:hypothetical protein
MHGGKFGRFRFMLRENADFNYRVIVDVMFLTNKPVLHAINEVIAFQAAKLLFNITAKTIWDVLRNMWIDTYIGSPDVIVINAGTNLTVTKFVNNAKAIIIEIEKVPIEAYYLIGKIEKYHDPVRRAYEIIMKKFGAAISSSNAFQMAIKSVNDTAGPNGLVPTLLIFGAYCHGQRHPRCSAPLPILSEEGNTLVLYFRTHSLGSCIKHACYYKVQS